MNTGYVSSTEAPGIFLILFYSRKGTNVLCRVCQATDVRDACAELGRTFSGEFVPADPDQVAWSRAKFKGQGFVEVLR